uniref:Esterase SG1-like n=1 Tax=Diabrotica virgifera virgifera TaxID=50390 RepID=A0A6P7H2W7_DIAVI
MLLNNEMYYLGFALTVLFQTITCDVVNTEEGPIEGRTYLTAYENKLCYAFQGVPFAETPKRFEPPLPKASWTNTLDCTYDRSVCVQTQGITNPTVIGSEDCLYLSVYSPD